MPVNFFGAPSENFQAAFVHVEVMAERGFLALPEPIHVHDSYEVIQLVDARQGSSFPNCALGAFAVPHEHIRAVIQFVQTRAQRHTHTNSQTLAERSGGDINKWQARRGVSLEVAANSPQFEKV